jgi:polyphosphate kinase 2 (PPK2 family)
LGTPAVGEVVFWDRSPAGDFVYGGLPYKRMKMMTHEFNGLEAKLMSEGILMVKMCIYADRPK